ncbi:UNVERIFIED_CONTAM: putative mitochondrial protein [Sesamum radiatum]|uniref:Mitochondrial protein n=1 Tax=Sesamum radiatum TaxID=300843 RepID=A0AAW2NR22_SESRA
MVVSGGILGVVKDMLGALLRVKVIPRHDRYLGLPAMGGRSRQMMFQNIRDRCWDRIGGWNSKMLSQAGKGVLVKAVVQALSTYAMSCFQLSVSLVWNLESMMADFWWHNRGDKRMHWVAWQKLCRSTMEGGFGFRELKEFNLALLAKQGWRILTKPESLLSKIMKAKYFPMCSLDEVVLGAHPSLTWRGSVRLCHY